MTEHERYLLERCLRLEAELLIARGESIPPPLPKIERRCLYGDPLPSSTGFIQTYHRASLVDIMQMRALRKNGLSLVRVGYRLNFSPATVRRYTKDMELI